MVGDAIEESGWLITIEDANDRSALRLRLEPVSTGTYFSAER
ncbi:hypothetical protein MGWOODY_XGa1520 [hydrothermal vent metagenome]|uniref:Uncharacterized protein n=1 Tax=hydrothermal vent metagenome TaxID=652676 RepID=A0A160TSS9_9ZZZZ